MAREMMYADAIAAAITEEMQRDPNVVFYGQNMAMTERDPTLKRFGGQRVRIAPISETAEIGIGIGAALTGLRPIVELWMSEFMLVAFDQVIKRSSPVSLHVGRTGERAGGAQGRLRLLRGMGRSALQLHLSHHDGHPRSESGGALNAG